MYHPVSSKVLFAQLQLFDGMEIIVEGQDGSAVSMHMDKDFLMEGYQLVPRAEVAGADEDVESDDEDQEDEAAALDRMIDVDASLTALLVHWDQVVLTQVAGSRRSP